MYKKIYEKFLTRFSSKQLKMLVKLTICFILILSSIIIFFLNNKTISEYKKMMSIINNEKNVETSRWKVSVTMGENGVSNKNVLQNFASPYRKDGLNMDNICRTETPQRLKTPFSGGVSTNGPDKLVQKVNTMKPGQKSRLYPNSLGSIIGQFKSVSTKKIRAKGFANFGWQSRYYDRIIKSKIQLDAACQYIKNNPKNWVKE